MTIGITVSRSSINWTAHFKSQFRCRFTRLQEFGTAAKFLSSETRSVLSSLVLTSQLPVTRWHEQIGDPTVADGILGRLVHNAHRIEMRADSMRKNRGRAVPSTRAGPSGELGARNQATLETTHGGKNVLA